MKHSKYFYVNEQRVKDPLHDWIGDIMFCMVYVLSLDMDIQMPRYTIWSGGLRPGPFGNMSEHAPLPVYRKRMVSVTGYGFVYPDSTKLSCIFLWIEIILRQHSKQHE